jgi:hypothetical protein
MLITDGCNRKLDYSVISTCVYTILADLNIQVKRGFI